MGMFFMALRSAALILVITLSGKMFALSGQGPSMPLFMIHPDVKERESVQMKPSLCIFP